MSYVYRFIDEKGNIIYVGKTVNINNRMQQHFSDKGHLPKECYREVAKIECIKWATKSDAQIMEVYYINKYKPKYNKQDKRLDQLTLVLEEKEWKTYEVLKRQVERYEAENGILTWIMLAALAGAVIQILLR